MDDHELVHKINQTMAIENATAFTPRFYAACCALQGAIACYGTPDDGNESVWKIHARDAVRAADDLIAALNKPSE